MVSGHLGPQRGERPHGGRGVAVPARGGAARGRDVIRARGGADPALGVGIPFWRDSLR